MGAKMGFVKVAETKDVPVGKMIHVEVDGNEILIANVGGKFYALGDRCPHLHAKVSEGTSGLNCYLPETSFNL